MKVKVRIIKQIKGSNVKVGTVLKLSDAEAEFLIQQGIAELVEKKITITEDEELAMWGLVTIPLEQKELIKFACNLFNGVIVDVENTKI